MSQFEKIPVCWVTPDHKIAGNAMGYAHHARMMKKYCEKFFVYDDNAPIAIQIVSADKYVPVEGKFNVLFTMWESLDLPPTYIHPLKVADLVVVPCRFCRDLFAPHTKVKPQVCFEGVEPKEFPFKQRQFPRLSEGEKFRFLWVGAPNPRKGYEVVLECLKVFEKMKDVEVYIKTTVPQTTALEAVWNMIVNWKTIRDAKVTTGRKFEKVRLVLRTLARLFKPSIKNKVVRMGKNKNVIFDTRVIPFSELVELYQSAHCFLLPSFGEGWGLTLCEALATGAPCIATMNTGTADFFDDSVGYVMNHEPKLVEMKNYNFHGRMYVPDTESCAKLMFHVVSNYEEALAKGKKGHERITTKFTWENSARRLYDIISEVAKEQQGVAV